MYKTSAQAVFFDLDGTLVDSAPDLSIALNQALQEVGLAPHGEAKVRQWIGNGVDRLLHRGLTDSMHDDASESEFKKLKSVFYLSYQKQSGVASRLYSGVKSTLQNLQRKSIPMVCITNKDRQFTIPLLSRLGINHFFQSVVCGDDVKHRKPHPEALLAAAKSIDVLPKDCLMVGDSKSDIAAALAAQVPIVCVDYGYAQGENLSDYDIELLISSFSDIEDCWDEDSPDLIAAKGW